MQREVNRVATVPLFGEHLSGDYRSAHAADVSLCKPQ